MLYINHCGSIYTEVSFTGEHIKKKIICLIIWLCRVLVQPTTSLISLVSLCMCVCLCVYGCWVVPKTWDPMDCSPPCSSILEIFQTRILERVAISFSRGSSQTSDWTHVSSVSCIGRQILCHWIIWEDWGVFSCGVRTLSCSMWDLVSWQWLNLGSLLWDRGTKKFIWELSWEHRSPRIARFIKNSRVYSPDYKIDFYSLVWSTSRWPRKPEAQNVYHWRWVQSLLCSPTPSSSALASGTAWVNPDSLVITCNIRVKFLSLDFAFLPIVSNRGKYKGWRLNAIHQEGEDCKQKKKALWSSCSTTPESSCQQAIFHWILLKKSHKLCVHHYIHCRGNQSSA